MVSVRVSTEGLLLKRAKYYGNSETGALFVTSDGIMKKLVKK